MFTEPFKNLISSGVKVDSLSGNILNETYRKQFIMDYRHKKIFIFMLQNCLHAEIIYIRK